MSSPGAARAEAHYGAALARMRFWNLAGIASSGLIAGGVVDQNGTATGWQWIAAAMLAANLTLGVWSGVRGAWSRTAKP